MPHDATDDATEASLKTLYRLMQRFESKLGGGEGYEGVYGSITLHGMTAVVSALQRDCGLTAESAFVDIGAGLGRPLMHVMVSPGLTQLWGIEVDGVKIQKALAFTQHVRQKLSAEGVLHETDLPALPRLTHSAVEKVATLEEFTHVYAFWEGVPEDGKRALGRLITASEFVKGVAVVQRAFRKCPVGEMAKLGFHGLQLRQSIKVRMSGSGQAFHAYVFHKQPPSSRRATVAYATPIKRHARRLSEDVVGELSVVRRSLVGLEIKEEAMERSKSDVGYTRVTQDTSVH